MGESGDLFVRELTSMVKSMIDDIDEYLDVEVMPRPFLCDRQR